MKRDFKRFGIMADPHCGHLVGLCPPAWQLSPREHNPRLQTIGRIEREMWNVTSGEIEKLKPFNGLFFLGDAIEGQAERTGGTELITTDRNEQCEMAAQCLRLFDAEQIVMVYGTPYHCGNSEDWEDVVARIVGATKIGSHEWPVVNGVTFDLKHFIASSSSIPHGRATAAMREKLWNVLWAEREGQPKSEILLRAHVHYYLYLRQAGYATAIVPCLQGAKTKFGSRRCSGTIDVGFLYFDIWGPDKWEMHERLFDLVEQRAKPLVL